MTSMKKLVLLILLLLNSLTFGLNAQTSGQIAFFNEPGIVNKANAAYKAGNYTLAEAYYREYVASNKGKEVAPNVWLQLADCYWRLKEPDACLETYQSLLQLNDIKLPLNDKVRLSDLYARIGDYDNAYKWIKTVPGYSAKAEIYADPEHRLALMKDSVNWNVHFLKINPSYRMASPIVIDDSVMLFISNRPYPAKKGKQATSDLSTSQLWKINLNKIRTVADMTPVSPGDMRIVDNNVGRKKLADVYWQTDVKTVKRSRYTYNIKQSLNLDNDFQGIPVTGMEKYTGIGIAIDKERNVYFTGTGTKKDKPGLKSGRYTSKGIDKIVVPTSNNDLQDAEQLTVSGDGTLLIYSSQKAHGKGGYDLYLCTRKTKKQPWSSPRPLTGLNTSGNEMYPVITADGMLYFSSDEMPGLGGLDIFRIPLLQAIAGQGQPEHMSYPINSAANDYGWAQSQDGLTGYFTSDRNYANDNIYSFHFDPGYILRGEVRNKMNGLAIPGATVFVYEKATENVFVRKTDLKGQYAIKITPESDVQIRAVINPYDSVIHNNITNELSSPINIEKISGDTTCLPLYVNRLNIGTALQLQMDTVVFYDFDKWMIKPEAFHVLDSIASLLQQYSLLHVEIKAYTDNLGPDEYNRKLSQKRAEAVVDYLSRRNIDFSRMQAHGFGKVLNITPCPPGIPCDETTHRLNRRSEIRINGFGTVAYSTENTAQEDLTLHQNNEILKRSALPANFFEAQKSITEAQASIRSFFTAPNAIEEKQQPDQTPDSVAVKDTNDLSTAEKEITPDKQPTTNTKISGSTKKPIGILPEKPFIQKEDGEYFIQTGAFKLKESAKTEAERINASLQQQANCFVSEATPVFYRVRIGYFKTYKEAVAIAKLLYPKF